MAEASILVDQHQFSCPVCLDLLKDPVTLPCGDSFCKVCINGHWDQEDQKDVFSCPQCRDTFSPRPVLRRNNMLAEVVEKLKKAEIPDASPAQCDTGPGDEECDLSTERKSKACMCCMMCLSCFCLKKNTTKYTIFDAEKICSEHNRMIEIDCCTDQSYICSLCMLNKHQGHAVSNESEGAEKQSELKENQERVEELKQAVNTIKHSAQTAVEQITAWEETELSRPQHQSPTVERHPLFDGVKNSLIGLKMTLEEFCEEESNKIPPHVEDAQSLLAEPQSRTEFLKYFRYLTLDPNTAHRDLILSEKNRAVRYSESEQQYSDHPDRFDNWPQVLSKESVSGRCYWEVEWESDIGVAIAVVYKGIGRKGSSENCKFARSNQSWSLECPSVSSVSFYHNSIETDLRAPSSRIGVYVDYSAGTLSFYSVSNTMELLHTVHTTFTQPLYAGFGFYDEAWNKSPTIRLCDSKKSRNIWLNSCGVL